jgi:hypothetical protein
MGVGNKRVKGIKWHVLTCSPGSVLGTVVTSADVHDTQAARMRLDRIAQDGRCGADHGSVDWQDAGCACGMAAEGGAGDTAD